MFSGTVAVFILRSLKKHPQLPVSFEGKVNKFSHNLNYPLVLKEMSIRICMGGSALLETKNKECNPKTHENPKGQRPVLPQFAPIPLALPGTVSKK